MADRAAPRDFLKGKREGNPKEEPAPGKPIDPDSFTIIVIISETDLY